MTEIKGHIVLLEFEEDYPSEPIDGELKILKRYGRNVIGNPIKCSEINFGSNETHAIALKNIDSKGTLVERMRIHTNGNVGIGPDDPMAKLDIRKTITHEFGTDKPGLTVGSLHISHESGASENDSASITFGAAQKAESAQSGIYVQSSENGTKMSFATTDNSDVGAKMRMLIDETGNIFLGTSKTETTTPENWVYVPNKLLIGYSDNLYYNKFGLKLDDVSTTAPTGEITSKALRLFHLGAKDGDNAEENNLLTVVKYNGNIGIGDMVPEEKLHVDGIVQANLGFKGDGSLITNLNGSNITSGIFSDAQIPLTISRSDHKHTGNSDDGPKILHSNLSEILGADTNSPDSVKNRHVSNAQAKDWQDHVKIKGGNPHHMTADDVNALFGGGTINGPGAKLSINGGLYVSGDIQTSRGGIVGGVKWKPIDPLYTSKSFLGVLPTRSNTISEYPIRDNVPSEAIEVLVYVYVRTGGLNPDENTEFQIYTSEGMTAYRYYDREQKCRLMALEAVRSAGNLVIAMNVGKTVSAMYVGETVGPMGMYGHARYVSNARYVQEGWDHNYPHSTKYKHYLLVHGYPQEAWSYNSDTFWLPLTSERVIKVIKRGANLCGNHESSIYIIGYR